MHFPALRVPTWLACCFVVSVLTGCASGGDVLPRGQDGGPRLDGGASVEDAGETLFCDPPCGAGQMCVDGRCMSASDADGDGVDGSVDCDDTDAAVGRTAERDCSSACGPGVERCTDGVWAACSAPSSCDCTDGTPPRTVPCSRCGMQRQVCLEGMWQNEGVCSGSGDCSPGEIGMGGVCGNCGAQRRSCGMDCRWGAWACEGEGVCSAGMVGEETESCGACGMGTRMRARTCSSSCAWGGWSAWGACSDTGTTECTPGAMETEMRPCGNCMLGRETWSRTCSATSCTWGSWTRTGSCSGGGTCAPGATRACANGDSCGQEVCSATCSWGSCAPRVAGGCLRIRPGTSGPAGNNYRCCNLPGDPLGGWQFCLASCMWSTACEASSACP